MTTTTPTHPSDLAASAEAAEAKANTAREKAAAARDAAHQAEVDAEARHTQLVHDFETSRQADYRTSHGGRIDAAWAAFVDAVRTGGDVLAAWRHYRVTRRRVAAEFRAFATVLRDERDAKAKVIRAEYARLTRESGMLGTTPKAGARPWLARPARRLERRRGQIRGRPHRPRPDGAAARPAHRAAAAGVRARQRCRRSRSTRRRVVCCRCRFGDDDRRTRSSRALSRRPCRRLRGLHQRQRGELRSWCCTTC